ncbi:diaminopimelate epimerase [Striga asiatica]|uniref:Diaminopimelate epimerase n=1 Tax=Striga asiatica TaxID=4170 RepID=A0A5A7PVC5_STRAF|nr:diaminopimelate epimerase [Striga asiatica]
MIWFLQIAQLSTTISASGIRINRAKNTNQRAKSCDFNTIPQAHRATAFHFLISNRFAFLADDEDDGLVLEVPAPEDPSPAGTMFTSESSDAIFASGWVRHWFLEVLSISIRKWCSEVGMRIGFWSKKCRRTLSTRASSLDSRPDEAQLAPWRPGARGRTPTCALVTARSRVTPSQDLRVKPVLQPSACELGKSPGPARAWQSFCANAPATPRAQLALELPFA